jgi:hypothetical protein
MSDPEAFKPVTIDTTALKPVDKSNVLQSTVSKYDKSSAINKDIKSTANIASSTSKDSNILSSIEESLVESTITTIVDHATSTNDTTKSIFNFIVKDLLIKYPAETVTKYTNPESVYNISQQCLEKLSLDDSRRKELEHAIENPEAMTEHLHKWMENYQALINDRENENIPLDDILINSRPKNETTKLDNSNHSLSQTFSAQFYPDLKPTTGQDDILEDVSKISDKQLQDSLVVFRGLSRVAANYDKIKNEDDMKLKT